MTTGRPLTKLVEELHELLQVEPDRASNYASTFPAAEKLASGLPLVHRTGDGQRKSWRGIFDSKSIRPSLDLSAEETECGLPHSVYFFLGSAAYPKGDVVLHVRLHEELGAGTFTPFDTGALGRGFLHHRDIAVPFATPSERAQHLARHCGPLASAHEYTKHFVAAHLEEPEAYVKAPQWSSPDFPTHHGLESESGDRRAWTIEVRVHGAVSLQPEDGHLSAILLGNKAIEEELEDELVGLVKFRPVGTKAEVDLALESAMLVARECET